MILTILLLMITIMIMINMMTMMTLYDAGTTFDKLNNNFLHHNGEKNKQNFTPYVVKKIV